MHVSPVGGNMKFQDGPGSRRAEPRVLAILLEAQLLRSRVVEFCTIGAITFSLFFAIAARI